MPVSARRRTITCTISASASARWFRVPAVVAVASVFFFVIVFATPQADYGSALRQPSRSPFFVLTNEANGKTRYDAGPPFPISRTTIKRKGRKS
jgi:hypothetical protein